jgi:type VI secretion system protein ImpL
MNRLLMYLKDFIKSKLGTAALGILALCCMVWFIASLFRASFFTKLLLIGIIISIFIVYLLAKWLWIKLAGEERHDEDDKVSSGGIKTKFEEAIKVIKTSELGIKYRGNGALYALPWFLVIGPAAAGKTALLLNSGLNYNYNDDQLPKSVNTKDCDWWFANEAIFLDTAGRYVTKESDEEWFEFLALLKKNRSRLPLNGIILALSLDDLLKQNIQNIRIKISELYYRLGYVIPVTLLVTKSDLLPGFEEFFADLASAEQKQIWGIDFSKNHAEQFKDLYARLSLLRFEKLAKEPDIVRRFSIYSFPEQFRNALVKVNDFVTGLLTANPYQDNPLLCGVYFTAKNYFINDLFREVILPNKFAAARTRHLVKLQYLTKSMWVMVCGLLLIVALMLFSTSLTSNILLLNRGTKAVEQLVQNESPATLQAAFNYYQLLVNYKSDIPWYLRLGLYRGNVLVKPLQNLLSADLQERFAKIMSNFLGLQLQQDYNQWNRASGAERENMRGKYYTALKAYLFLCYPTKGNLDEAAAIMTGSGIGSEQMIKFYLEHASPAVPNLQLIARARKQLAVSNPAINLSAELVFILHDSLKSYGLTDLVKNRNLELLTSANRVSGMYTLDGWHNQVKPMLANITGSDKLLAQNLTALYFSDYQRAWLNFLASIRVRSFNSLSDANNEIKILVGNDSPLVAVLKEVARNTSLPEVRRNFIGIDNFKTSVYMEQVAKIQNDLQRLALSPNVSHEAEQYAANLLSGVGGETQLYQSMVVVNSVTNNIADLAVRNAVKELLLQPLRESWRIILQAARNDVEQNWQAQVVNIFKQTIANKFPFSRYSQEDISASEISSFLQPNSGMLWTYINTNLKPFLTTAGNGLQEQRWLNLGLGFNSQALQQLNQVRAASVGLFASGQLSMNYQIYPIPTKDISSILFTLNGKKYSYSNGPQVWQSFNWSSSSGEQVNSLTAITASGSNLAEINTSGVWGLLHLISGSKMLLDRDGVYHLTWQLTGRGRNYPISILLRAGGHNNVLAALLGGRLSVPVKLF